MSYVEAIAILSSTDDPIQLLQNYGEEKVSRALVVVFKAIDEILYK